MTDTPSIPKPAPKPTPPTRKPSAKTLYRLLHRYLSDNKVPGGHTVTALMDRLKASIVEEEVGVSLDGWET